MLSLPLRDQLKRARPLPTYSTLRVSYPQHVCVFPGGSIGNILAAACRIHPPSVEGEPAGTDRGHGLKRPANPGKLAGKRRVECQA